MPEYAKVLNIILENVTTPDNLKESLKKLLVSLNYPPKENAGVFQNNKVYRGQFADHLRELYNLDPAQLIEQCLSFRQLLSEDKHSSAPLIRNQLLSQLSKPDLPSGSMRLDRS